MPRGKIDCHKINLTQIVVIIIVHVHCATEYTKQIGLSAIEDGALN